MVWFFSTCCGRRRRRRLQQAERDTASPFQPKTARFYGVQPLFPDPTPKSRPISSIISECGTDTNERNRECRAWTPEIDEAPAFTRSQIIGGEKLERWLGESLRTIPEDDKFDETFELDGKEVISTKRRTFLLSISSPGASGVDEEEVDFVVQGTASSCGGEEWDESSLSPAPVYRATFLHDESFISEDTLSSIVTQVVQRQSTDCSTIESGNTAAASSWIVYPLRAAPRQLQSTCVYDIDEQAGNRRSSVGSSTELAMSSAGSISEFGFERKGTLRRKPSANGSFRFGRLRREASNPRAIGRRRSTSLTRLELPELPGPSAQIPWRTVSIRAVRRQIQDPLNKSGTLDDLWGNQAVGESILQDTDTDSSGSVRVHNWVSGQLQYHNNPSPPARPTQAMELSTSRYPIGDDFSRSMTLASVSLRSDTTMSAAPKALHDETCSCYEEISAPSYHANPFE